MRVSVRSTGSYYKGISFPFRFGSSGGVAKSILTHSDFSRIKESITQILFTYQNERVMNNLFGSPRQYVFENLDDVTERALFRHEIVKAIETYEDRVEVIECRLYPDPTKEGTLIVSLDLHIIKFVKDVTLQLEFEYANAS